VAEYGFDCDTVHLFEGVAVDIGEVLDLEFLDEFLICVA
jgi:hypothetical protein